MNIANELGLSEEALPKGAPQPQSTQQPAARDVVLRAVDVRRSFGGTVVLDGVTAELRRGEVVLLRGDNGSGKTTLLNVLTGSLAPDSGSISVMLSGRGEHFAFPKPWLQSLNLANHFTPERVARAGISRTWQEIRLFSSQNLRDNIAIATPGLRGENPLSVLFRPFEVRRETVQTNTKARALLHRFGMGARENSSADRVSLGQSKRVAIARSIQAGGQILLLDEPLAGLDRQGIRDVIDFLAELARSGDITLVVVEHVFNIPLILRLATKVWTLDRGRLTEETPEQAYGDVPSQEAGRDLDEWLKQVAGSTGSFRSMELPGGGLLSIADRQPGDSQAALLDLRDVVVSRTRTPIIGRQREDGSFEGLTFKLWEGSIGVLHAPNGWGKTTLLEAVSGFIPLRNGSISVNSHSVERTSTWERARNGLSILQSRYHSFDNLSVAETLRLARAEAWLDEFSALARSRVGALSGGQKQRLAIAVASAGEAKVRILDEPFSMLDAATINRVRAAIAARTKEATLILVPAARAF
jgi:ABC-type branched-subunit amino acid transport system ATPase component